MDAAWQKEWVIDRRGRNKGGWIEIVITFFFNVGKLKFESKRDLGGRGADTSIFVNIWLIKDAVT